jgi:site-specific recombinase XerD
MRTKPTDFGYHLSRYFTQHLPGRLGLSSNTIRSYRDAFAAYLEFCQDVDHLAPERLTLVTLTPDRVAAFLAWIEEHRGCSLATRNQRLAAVRAFVRYLETAAPEFLHQWQQLLAMRRKRQPKPAIDYLTLAALKRLLAVPDRATRTGRRHLVLLSVLYDTAARVQELADARAQDLRLESPATLQLTGKGQKTRIVPLMSPTTALLQQYLTEASLDDPAYGPHPLFPNRSGRKMTRAGIAYLVKKYADQARKADPTGMPAVVSPHVLRHSKAMHLLQSGVDLVYIRDLLGHVSITTTEVYARADSEMKRRALEAAYPTEAATTLPPWQADTELLAWLKSLGH